MSSAKEQINIDGFNILTALLGFFEEYLSEDDAIVLDNIRRRIDNDKLSTEQRMILGKLGATVLLEVTKKNPHLVMVEQ